MQFRKPARGEKLIGSLLLVSLSSPSYSYDINYQQPGTNSMTVDSLTISSVADPIKGGAIVLGDKNSVLGNMNLVVKNTQLAVTDTNIEHGIVVGTYTTRAKLISTISDSLVKFKSTGAVTGYSVGILSEGGVDVAGQSHALNLSNVTVDMEATGGQFASGILAQTQPSTIGGAAAKLIDIELSGVNQIQVAHTGADGLYAAGIDASKGDNEQVIIHEQDAGGDIQVSATQGTTATYGMFVNSSLSKGQNTITSRSTISSISAGGNAYGISAKGMQSTIKHDGSLYAKAGDEAYGIYAEGSLLDIDSGAAIIADGKHTSYGIYSDSSGTSTITSRADITALGDHGTAIYSKTTTQANTVNVLAGHLQGSGTGAGVYMESTDGEQILSNHGSISAANDLAIHSVNSNGKTTVTNAGTVTGYSTLTGNEVTFANEGGILNLQDLTSSSAGVKGRIVNTIGDAGTGTFINNGMIQFSADSLKEGTNKEVIFNVATFNNNAMGSIDLTGKNPQGRNNKVGDTFTINGDYVSSGGSIYMNTKLDDASSNNGQGISDLIIVNGDVTTGSGGATQLYITATKNSLGKLTAGDGIKVIEVQGTSSADAFALGRPVTAGAYEYLLGKGTGNQNWYLSSFYNPTTGGGGNSGTGQIMYSPAIGAYLANQTAAVEMFQQTLFDRLISSSGFDQDASKKLFWLRTSMTHGSRRSVDANFSNRNRSYMMQLGGDLGVWQLNNGYLHVGLMAGYGDAKNTSTSRLTRTEADGKVKGYSTGIYGTWFQNQDTNLGLYVDTWSQMGWYRNEVSGQAQLSTKKYNSTVWSNSVEVGYGLALGNTSQYQWLATPQLQLTYNSYDADNQTDKNNLYVSNNQASGLATRTGIRLHGKGLQKKTIEPFVEMNWLHSTAKNQLHFNGERLRDGLPQNRFETKIGLQGDINDKWSVSAQVGGQWGQNNFNQYQGQLNVNYKW